MRERIAAVQRLRFIAERLDAKLFLESCQEGLEWTSVVKFSAPPEISFKASATGSERASKEQVAKEALNELNTSAITTRVVLGAIAQNGEDYTTALKEICQFLSLGRPQYEVSCRGRLRYDTTVTLSLSNNRGRVKGTGRGKSKVESRRAAAKQALIKLGLIRE